MIIDSHEHYMIPTERQITMMNEAGIDKTILFSTAPHPERAGTFMELKREMDILYKILSGDHSKEANIRRMKDNIEEMVKVLRKYPERFWGFGPVPLGLTVKDTAEWIENDIIFNNFKGVGEFTPGSDEQICELETIFQALEEYPGIPLWIHTFQPVTLSGIRILMELTRKYPKIPVIYGHMGGYHWMDVIEFAGTVPNAFIDLSAAFSTLAVRMALTELPEKCLFSSDAPYGDPLYSRRLVEDISPSDEICDQVLGGNILRLLGENPAIIGIG